MSRREFPVAVKTAAWERCQGKCDGCGTPFRGRIGHYDHIRPDGLGGEPTLENCQVLCRICHEYKTHQEDRPVMAKADRQRKSDAGIKPKRQGFRGWRDFAGNIKWRD